MSARRALDHGDGRQEAALDPGALNACLDLMPERK